MMLSPATKRKVMRETVPLGAMLLAALIDYVTPAPFAVSPFYLCVLVPVALRRPWNVAMTYGVIASAVFMTVDVITNPESAGTIYPYWRGFSQLITFSLVTFTIPLLVRDRQRLVESERTLIQQRQELEQVNARLVGTLEELVAMRERDIQQLVQQQRAALKELVTMRERHLEPLVREQRAAVEELTRMVRPVLATVARLTPETVGQALTAGQAADPHVTPSRD